MRKITDWIEIILSIILFLAFLPIIFFLRWAHGTGEPVKPKRKRKSISKFKSFWWSLTDRCQYCGGQTWDWSTDRSYCYKCGRRNG